MLFKDTATATLEVRMLNHSFMLAFLKGILYHKKIENFVFMKICTR